MRALYIEANRGWYNPSQCEHATMTVEELIDCLTEMGEAYGYDAKVFIRHDGGYTYGSIGWEDMSEGGYDGERSWLGEARDE